MRIQDVGGDNRIGHTEQGLGFSGPMGSSFSGLNIWDIFRVLSRWWWVIGFITLATLLITFYFVSKTTPVYMASSIIEVKQQERQIFDQDSDVENFVVDSEFFNTQIELLKSDTLAGDIIDQFNLISDPEFAPTEGSRANKRNTAIGAFSNKLRVGAVGRSRLIKVSFEHTSPKMAKDIANAVTDSFVTYNLERKYNATSYARDFIEDRLKSTKTILEKSERELVEYAANNDLVTVQDSQGNVSLGFWRQNLLLH